MRAFWNEGDLDWNAGREIALVARTTLIPALTSPPALGRTITARSITPRATIAASRPGCTATAGRTTAGRPGTAVAIATKFLARTTTTGRAAATSVAGIAPAVAAVTALARGPRVALMPRIRICTRSALRPARDEVEVEHQILESSGRRNGWRRIDGIFRGFHRPRTVEEHRPFFNNHYAPLPRVAKRPCYAYVGKR